MGKRIQRSLQSEECLILGWLKGCWADHDQFWNSWGPAGGDQQSTEQVMTLPFDIRLILRSGLFGGSSAAAWRYHATWHNSFLILLVFVLRFLFGCLALFSFISALFNSSSCNFCGCCGCDCYRCCAWFWLLLWLLSFCFWWGCAAVFHASSTNLSFQHFQRFQQAASIRQSSVSSVPRPP